MSTAEGEAITAKERKAQRDAERRKPGKTKKRKLDETEDGNAEDAPVEEAVVKKSKSKKRKAIDDVDGEGDITAGAEKGDGEAAKTPAEGESAAARPKKSRKKKKNTAVGEGRDTSTTADNPAATDSSKTKSKFILFIGNLPYKTTDASLQQHFKSLQPFNLRHRTEPGTKKSKGFAFLEFENYDRMKTCLKLFHHSTFDPDVVDDKTAATAKAKAEVGGSTNAGYNGRKPKDQTRKINVELTAGGGGTTDARKEKIKVKNERLEEQRKRRAEAEAKDKERKEKKERLKAGKGATGANAEVKSEEEAKVEVEASGIHPSRLRRGVDF